MTQPTRIDMPLEVAFFARPNLPHLENRRAQNITKLLRLRARTLNVTGLHALVELHIIPDYRDQDPTNYRQALDACVIALTDLGVITNPGTDVLHRIVIEPRNTSSHACRMYLLLRPLTEQVSA